MGEEELQEVADDTQEHEARQAAKAMFAFCTWTCPNCNFNYAENSLPRYKCFCGRYEEPEYQTMSLPHSCGEYCERKKHEGCSHARCDLLCHPGSCPPCGIAVPVSCHCGKESQRVPCQIASRTKFGCGNKCGKLLNCLAHECEQQCHEGPCQPCSVQVEQACFCGAERHTVNCGSPRESCGKVCNKTLDCGKHKCQKRCHDGPCAPCPFQPERLKYCPCGYNTIESLIGRERKACTDPIPRCGHPCEKFLPCGIHQCKLPCHTGSC